MIRPLAVPATLLLLLLARPAAAFDGIRVTLPGGVDQSAQDPVGPGIVVEAGNEVLLFDCGAGLLEQLRAGIPAVQSASQMAEKHVELYRHAAVVSRS